MERHVILHVGNQASGKTKASRHLAEEKGFQTVRMSGLIEEYAGERQIPLFNRRSYSLVFNRMIEDRGSDGLVDDILATTEGSLSVDGPRIPEQILRFREHGAIVVAYWCDTETRYERRRTQLIIHGETPPTYEEFIAGEQYEYDSHEPPGIATITVMQMADHHIDSTQPLAVVHAQLDAIVDPLAQRAA